jgi:hypothetical protein
MNLISLNLSRLYNFFVILFSRNWRLRVDRLNYYRYWRFSNAYLVIQFKVFNAIWFRIGNISGTDFNKPIVLNLSQINEDEILLEFFAVCQKWTCLIDLKKEASMNSEPFKTKINNVYKATLTIPDSKINLSDINFIRHKHKLHQENFVIQNHSIKTEFPHFNIEEHI